MKSKNRNKRAVVVKIDNVEFGGKKPLALIAGPCVIEGRSQCVRIAGKLAQLAEQEKIPFVFKASYDKANRTSHKSYRGPGMVKGLEILREIKEKFGVPVLTDVHSEQEVPLAADVVDILQLPAFLARQTDLVLALGHSGKPVNVKKAQFMAPWDMEQVVAKLESTGNRKIMLTERGASFGYNRLVTDMTSLPIMRETGYPVIFDATHSVQLPGGAGTESGGNAGMVSCLSRAAVAAGCDGLFLETHINPAEGLSDRTTMLEFSKLKKLWRTLAAIDSVVREG
ncbi:MAG: 3-deoxy-8-phosphooctulonate synthase [Lentisphaerae bacterium]|nr:3-deoxy-8-phosphooctulonate synthase [Lentisphaerota bacterium]